MEKIEYYPPIEEFRTLAGNYNIIPVVREVVADTETPVSAFLKIDDGGEAFLLESVEGGEEWGRYSFLGSSPRAIIQAKGGVVEIIEGGRKTVKEGDPIAVLDEYMSKYRTATVKGAPRFSGGAIGYMGYDMVRYIERLPDTTESDIDQQELCFLITETMLVFDNVQHKIQVLTNAHVGDDDDVDEVYRDALEKIDGFVRKIRYGDVPARVENSSKYKLSEEVISNFPKKNFIEAVNSTKEYIRAGDIIQAVISQRFEAPFQGSPFDIYRALRVINPSPYMFFMRLGGIELAGSSPEILVRVEDDEINVRPIAGTRPRGSDASEDSALQEELLSDPKERAEHIMLVDLGRNDVGRVAKAGTVVVDELMTVEKYSHVMHIVSNVHGTKKKDVDSFDVLRACFPAGTLTGAPKIRAMEIIEEMEPCKRGVYGGSVGYIGFSGNMDVCITIRTVLIKDGRVYVQAGAGIVADSDPEKEYEETVNKAKGILKAVNMASGGFY